MKNVTLKKILMEINKRIKGSALEELQFLRKEVLGLSKIPSRNVFPEAKPGKDYVFHIGGRRELQFNIGINKQNETVRFGVAYSIFRDISLQNIDDLRPSINLFNDYIINNPSLLKGKIMGYSGAKDSRPKVISDELIINGTFIFFGIRQTFNNINYDEAVNCLNSLLPLYLHTIAGKPRKANKRSFDNLVLISEDEESAFSEGKEKYRLHRSLERDRRITQKAKLKRNMDKGKLCCDVCDFNFSDKYGKLGDGYIEAHHTIPVASLRGNAKTKLSDIALVCANCHRMLHTGASLLTVNELKTIYKKNSKG